ncbi:hypothetical protein PROFUN_00331 [Planoprotostelium fungivorum]|uniref:EF-hand domain-containing protein n=1 Tax=Planoprotostelium fungivorum TaxID=1890364 RepID=A0A2P6NY23_9EUKA|nr:hypothetical protein PROFUN_00331 [Planoprotostelium fungivorum]
MSQKIHVTVSQIDLTLEIFESITIEMVIAISFQHPYRQQGSLSLPLSFSNFPWFLFNTTESSNNTTHNTMSALNNAALESKLESNLEKKLAHGRVEDEKVLLNERHHANPLDRNGDGRVDLNDLSGRRLSQGHDATLLTQQQGVYVQSTKRASLVRAEPTIIETIQKDVVIQERIHPVQKEEIQPIIYREREQLDVKQVTQLLHETQIQPTIVQQRELPAERREAIIERGAAIQENFVASSRQVDAATRTQVVHAPIVQEVIKKTIIEEIQPVLERDIIQSTVIQNTQPIYEKIVEAPHVHRSTVIVQDRGIIGGDIAALQAQGFNLGEAGNRLSGGYAQPLAGQRLSQGYTQAPLMGQGLQGAHHNPLDRNHDGRVDARDFAGQPGYNQQGQRLSQGYGQPPLVTSHGLVQPMVGQQGLDRNHDGRIDARDFAGQPGYGQQGLAGGLHQNPLDRNHDGRVDARDFAGQPGYGQQGLAGQPMMGQGLAGQGLHQNPLDRNHDGRVDLKDLTGQPGYGQQGLAGQQPLLANNQGMVGGAKVNPLDRNHDGRVDLKDLTGRPAPVNTL